MSAKKIKVAIVLSPLLRDREGLAEDIINSGLESTDPSDWQQQRLGLASSSDLTNITDEMVDLALGAPTPDREPDFRLCGIDQGRSGGYWLVIVDYWLGAGDKFIEIDRNTIRKIRYAQGIVKTAIPDILREWVVEFGTIDNEPNIAEAAEICEITGLEMVDQKPGQMKDIIKSVVEDGAIEYPCWKVRNEKFLQQVLNIFALKHPDDDYPLARLPGSWEKWKRNPSARSPLRHLQSMSVDPETRKWQRPADHNDDIYFGLAFCEIGFLLWVQDLVGL